ncbi:L,D-transpeptidase family protein [Litorisediminicola beolgyonensis]|uniref:Murein L,D-transpeptidase family protein n=1 Tax=Litorisediminicola beolgyonensis TaxID=1173614 RepID=A0ABW3ZLJ0_9RHOB
MTVTRLVGALLLAVALSGCGSKFKTYNGPEVTQVLVLKEERKMFLLHGRKALKEYDIKLGFTPEGHKAQQGDGRTPEGLYFIDRRNPESKFHLSIGINYPNNRDIEVARAAGINPGGDIFIHGGPQKGSKVNGSDDWTWGCIAVEDHEIEDIYAMVKDGTPILIQP